MPNLKDNYIKDALRIHELYIQMESNCTDDGKNFNDYTLNEYLKEANYVLSCFYEGGHINNEDLNSNDDNIRIEAEKQIKQLEKYIKKYKNQKQQEELQKQRKFFDNVNIGDKILLIDGDIVEFIKLNRTRFIGTIKENEYTIPINMVVKKLI
ncbi:hypothetical protein ACYJ2U_001700 [Clostridium botulinum]